MISVKKSFDLLKPGDVLAERYSIEDQIGSGRSGVVYLAFDKELYKHVAIKVIAAPLATQAQFQARLFEEVGLCKNIHHPNIASVFDVQKHGQRVFLSLELLKGQNLRDYLQHHSAADNHMSVDEARKIIGQIGNALVYAHQLGVVHGDIRPENIWLTDKGNAKIMGFGLAKLLNDTQTSATAQESLGYSAPELLNDPASLDERADQYALAVMFTEMLTGSIAIGHIEALHKRRKDLPRNLIAAINRAISAKREQRYPNMEAFLQSLLATPLFSLPEGKSLAMGLAGLLLAIGWIFYSHLFTPVTQPRQISPEEQQRYRQLQHAYSIQLKLLLSLRQETKDLASQAANNATLLEQQLMQTSDDGERYRLSGELEQAKKRAQLHQQIGQAFEQEAETIAALTAKPALADTLIQQRGDMAEALSLLQAGIRQIEQLRVLPRNVTWHINGKIAEQTQPKQAPALLNKATLFQACSSCPEMVALPGGVFTMGSHLDEKSRFNDEAPHSVTVKRFALARHEVTRAEYQLFVESSGYTGGPCLVWDGKQKKSFPAHNATWQNPAYSTYAFKQTSQHPVVCVSYDDAEAYINWLNQNRRVAPSAGLPDVSEKPYRLPSEAEWEYAARGGTATARYWGNDETATCDYANVMDQALNNTRRFNGEYFPCVDNYYFTAPVGSFQANAFGLYDMLGNVWEWTCSVFSENYNGSELRCADNNNAEFRRVFRGGSWYNGPTNVRAANRYSNSSNYRYSTLGFRLAQDL